MSLSFNRAFDPRPGEPVAVAPGVRRITADNPGPFTFRGTNTYLIGADRLAIVDPGPDDPGHVAAILAAAGGSPIEAILVTHSHRDHAPAAKLVAAATGAPILAAGLERIAPPLPADPDVRLDAGADQGFLPDQVLRDGDRVEADGFVLEAIATPGHASDHLAFALHGSDLLFSGDHVMGWATTVVAPPDGSMRAYMQSLARLLARPETLYLPGHGEVIRNAPAYVRGLRTHRRMRERAILERLERGDSTIPEMVANIYTDVDPRLHGAAALSTLAHLQDLVARGLAATSGRAMIDARYRPGGRGRGAKEPGDPGSGTTSSGGVSSAAP